MTVPVGSLSGAMAPQQTTLDQVSAQTTADLHRSDLLSGVSQSAFESISKYPGQVEKETRLKNEIAGQTGDNPFLSGANVPQKPEALSDQFITKMSGLYNEVTVYQVAWNMAKRTGRDIETLLRAQ